MHTKVKLDLVLQRDSQCKHYNSSSGLTHTQFNPGHQPQYIQVLCSPAVSKRVQLWWNAPATAGPRFTPRVVSTSLTQLASKASASKLKVKGVTNPGFSQEWLPPGSGSHPFVPQGTPRPPLTHGEPVRTSPRQFPVYYPPFLRSVSQASALTILYTDTCRLLFTEHHQHFAPLPTRTANPSSRSERHQDLRTSGLQTQRSHKHDTVPFDHSADLTVNTHFPVTPKPRFLASFSPECGLNFYTNRSLARRAGPRTPFVSIPSLPWSATAGATLAQPGATKSTLPRRSWHRRQPYLMLHQRSPASPIDGSPPSHAFMVGLPRA